MIRRIITAFATFALAVSVVLPALAQMQEPYTVRDVSVSVTADNATQARIDALSEAERKGFDRLLEQLQLDPATKANLAALDASAISRMVRSYEVRDEKVTATSYEANLDIAYDPQQVKNFSQPSANNPMMGATGNAYQVGQMVAGRGNSQSTILVLPIERKGGTPQLWSDNNEWRRIWSGVDRDGTSVIRLPVGDQSDQAVMSAELAANAPYQSFGPIAERYQAASILVAEAIYTDSPGASVVDVNLRSMSVGGQSNSLTLTYEAQPDETMNDVLYRAAGDIAQRLLAEGRSHAQAQTQPQNRITVLSQLGNISDWVLLRRRLMQLPGVERIELSAISNQQADLVVHFQGSPDVLANNMAAQGLSVSQAYNYWVVTF